MDVNPHIQVFFALGLLIAAAKLAGNTVRRFGQPRVFGELVAGVILGPTLLNFLQWPVFSDAHLIQENIKLLAELGVVFLMFNIGLEVDIGELFSVGRVAIFGGTLGAFAPILLTVPAILFLTQYTNNTALFAGVVLAATSVSISAQTLVELDKLQTREGSAVLGMALVDDVLAVVILAFVIALTSSTGEENGSVMLIIVRLVLYLAGSMAVTWFIIPRLMNRIYDHDPFRQYTASFGIVIALIFAWSAESLGGIAAISGAFIAGVGIGRAHEAVQHEVTETVSKIAYVFLAPIFFVSVGLESNLLALPPDLIPLAILLLGIAVISKVGGCGFGGIAGGLKRGESFRAGVCMISRGEVGLIIVALGLANGLLDESLFSTLFLVVLLTTVFTPPMVRWAFRH